MYKNLGPGCVGLKGPFAEIAPMAAAAGFEGIDPDLSLPPDQLAAVYAETGLRVGTVGLPVDFRKDDATFAAGLANLPAFAAKAAKATCTRCATWLMPASDELPYAENFRLHAARLSQAAAVLADHGLRFGLEFVGPKTSRVTRKHPFIHTLAQVLDLCAAIDRPGVGILLDAWHWYTSGGTAADLAALRNEQIVLVHLNDAPAGIPVDEQKDGVRDLPAATGVIDTATFLRALRAMGYDGPVTPEPFCKRLNDLTREQCLAEVAGAMHRAWAMA